MDHRALSHACLTKHLLICFHCSYYPLYPTHKQDEVSNGARSIPDVNFDLLLAYEKGHALLPVRPDVLVLPSDLKPFVKVCFTVGLSVCLMEADNEWWLPSTSIDSEMGMEKKKLDPVDLNP